MTDVVIFEEIACNNGKKIAIAILNSPKSLNALSGDMIDLLYPKLLQWQQQENIAVVFLQGAGDKAFCAGGDIVHLYQAMKSQTFNYRRDMGENDAVNKSSPEICTYFTKEYQLDYLIRQFKKPFVVWGHGIVMGGGLGLLSAASHRIVTEKSRIAMPEISIGLFPDVGASYFLNKMPHGNGLFLALTGASINAADAKFCQLADFFIENSQKDPFVEQLSKVTWTENTSSNHETLNSLLNDIEQGCLGNIPRPHLHSHQPLIEKLSCFENLAGVFAAIVNHDIEDEWFNKAQRSLKSGSALSAHIAYRQLAIGKELSLADCFRLELNLAVKSGLFGEFAEGIRALLIDKDYNPQWRFGSLDNVEQNIVDWFFEAMWTKEKHPLTELSE